MSRKFDYSTCWNWNGNLMCSVGIFTTGNQAGFDDLIEVCILALNSQLQPSKDVIPFSVALKPKRPENYYEGKRTNTRVRICEAKLRGFDPYEAADLLEVWFKERLKLAPGKKIIPLVCCWQYTYTFLVDWLGFQNFNYIFDWRYRDVQSFASSLNDRAEFQTEIIPYPKTFLQYLCSQLKVERPRPHTAAEDAMAIPKVYWEQIKKSM